MEKDWTGRYIILVLMMEYILYQLSEINENDFMIAFWGIMMLTSCALYLLHYVELYFKKKLIGG